MQWNFGPSPTDGFWQSLKLWDKPRPVYENPQQLWKLGNKRQEVIWENVLRLPPMPGRPLDRRGVLVWKEERMRGRAGYVLGWVQAMLGLNDTEGWRRSQPPSFLKEFFPQWYSYGGTAVGIVIVEGCRDQIRLRHSHRFQEKLAEHAKPVFAEFPQQTLELEGIRLPLKDMRIAAEGETRKRAEKLTTLAITREIETEGTVLRGRWTTYCLARPVDHDAKLHLGFAPYGARTLLPSGINTARLVSFVKVFPKGWTENFAFDIDPFSGEVLSLRYGGIPLRMFNALDPRMDIWLRTALGD